MKSTCLGKLAVAVSTMALMVSLAGAAPIIGTFVSEEFGGQVLNGRWSESYYGGGPDQIGNVMNAASWNGTALGTQWTLTGPAIEAAPAVLHNSVVNGTGARLYRTPYDGGTLTLKDPGPWWGEGLTTGEYDVSVTEYFHSTYATYVNYAVTSVTTIIDLKGTFDGHPGYEISFLVAVAVPIGEGAEGDMPANYPGFLPPEADSGQWGVIQKVRLEVTPEPGSILLLVLGGAAVMVRRRR